MSGRSSPLTLIRHGQSQWNLADRFTGWTDIDLTETGRAEARHAGTILQAHGLQFDICFTSVLTRAVRTAWLVLDAIGQVWLPFIPDWRLNERHYGALQGRNKTETTAQYGEAQVIAWRRGFSERPPALAPDDARQPRHDPRYAMLSPDLLPSSESLQDTVGRVVPYWEGSIAPLLREGRRVLIVAHGNSLRGLVKYLDGISDADVADLDIATGHPIAYRLDAAFRPIGRTELH